MKPVFDLLASRRFAVYLLAATLLVILLSNLLPNLSIMRAKDLDALRENRPLIYAAAKRFQTGRIVQSPFFLIFPVFIFASITVCTVRRIGKERSRERKIHIGEAKHTVPFSGEADRVKEFVEKRGWEIDAVEGGSIQARKGGSGFWGSVLFHVGMNVVLIGVLLSLITRFNGSMTLTEGYGVDIKEGFLGEVPDDFPVRGALLEGFRAVYAGGFAVDYQVDLLLSTEFDDRRVQTGVNEPVSVGWYHISPARYGYAPRFILKKGDAVVLDGYINLVVFTPEQVDHFDLPEEDLTVVVQFFPDYYKDGLTPKTRSKELKNPVSFVEIRKGNDVLGRGFLPLNKEVSFSGYSLECRDVKMWVIFDVARDLGVPPVTLGFILIVAGLIIRLVWHEKTIWITTGDGILSVGGRSRYFPALFEDELKRLAEGIKEANI